MKYKNFADIFSDLKPLISDISNILKASGYSDYEEINFEASDAQERFLKDELNFIFHSLYEASEEFLFLDRPVIDDGFLHLNSAGRYTLNGFEFTSGSLIEIFYPAPDSDFPEDERWISTRIEHNGNDYYAVGIRYLPLEGCRARRR